MKKKILFIEEALGIGGAEKSLLTILSLFDYEKYDVSLFLFSHNREQMNMIPRNVNLLHEDSIVNIFLHNRKKAPYSYFKIGEFKKGFASIRYLIGCCYARIMKKKMYIGWRFQRVLFPELIEEYDVVISFLERRSLYFAIDKVKAKKHISFIHNDYSIYPYDKEEDDRCFSKCSAIVTVSEHCKCILQQIFPDHIQKMFIIKNMVSLDLIQKMAKVENVDIKCADDVCILVTVGRLVYQKGIDRAIEVCSIIKKKGIQFQWYVVGEGGQKEELVNMINQLGLTENFYLVGLQINPYKWMNMADIYVQPSRFEGFGITVAEANCLNKPIVCSDIPEFREQLGNRENCYSLDVQQMAENIVNLIKLNYCQEKDKNNTVVDTIKTMQRLYMLIED